jgi:hypothetical protein
MECAVAKMAVVPMRSSYVLSSSALHWTTAMRVFLTADVKLLAWPLVSTHKQKVLALRFCLKA